MTESNPPQILKGTRDYLPPQSLFRSYLIDTVKDTFEEFGFEPMDTPAIEYAETLEGKYGDEGEKLIYKFFDRGERKVALRYDLTVPLSRVIAMYPEILKPFKRYQISPVWRADKPQKGRYREFLQCDADIVGSASSLADAEIIALTYKTLQRLGVKEFIIRINNRKILNGVASFLNLSGDDSIKLFRTLDKLEKRGKDEVTYELKSLGFSDDIIERLWGLLLIKAESNINLLEDLEKRVTLPLIGLEGINELKEILEYLDILEISPQALTIDFSLARGLDYYTGPFFETTIRNQQIGSITGGGRYDNLIGLFSHRHDIPATGTTIGLERIIALLNDQEKLTQFATSSQVLVTIFDKATLKESLSFLKELRQMGIRSEIYLGAKRLNGQLSYASSKGIPLVTILGPEEIERRSVTIKDMKKGIQHSFSREAIHRAIKELVAQI